MCNCSLRRIACSESSVLSNSLTLLTLAAPDRPEEVSHESSSARLAWPDRFRARARHHGDVRHVRPGRSGREHRDDPRRARRGAWTLLDTGDFYGMGHNEMLVRRSAEGPQARSGAGSASNSARCAAPGRGSSTATTRGPAAIRNFVAYALKAAGRRHIDIYRPARLDPGVPIEDTIGAIAELNQGRDTCAT